MLWILSNGLYLLLLKPSLTPIDSYHVAILKSGLVDLLHETFRIELLKTIGEWIVEKSKAEKASTRSCQRTFIGLGQY